ncbi:MAG: hypothetical protein WC836_22825, partial [Desulfobacula sp.]
STAGSVVNQGRITAADGGYVALLAPEVRNEGIITAKLGSVVMGAGERVTLDMEGDGLINFEVDQKIADASIKNKGMICADGGMAIMSAGTADNLISSVVNNEGIVLARSISNKNGIIRLEGNEVTNSGTLDVSGKNTGETGGTIKVLGEKTTLDGNAVVDASGDAGGGTILIGGNYQGKGPEANAKETTIGRDVKITADAIQTGNGGKVIAWADDKTTFNGSISAKGGALSGNGGFVETSGHTLKTGDTAVVDTRAPK